CRGRTARCDRTPTDPRTHSCCAYPACCWPFSFPNSVENIRPQDGPGRPGCCSIASDPAEIPERSSALAAFCCGASRSLGWVAQSVSAALYHRQMNRQSGAYATVGSEFPPLTQLRKTCI